MRYARCIVTGMNTFTDVINRWETVADFAADLCIPYQTGAAWRQRNSIPAQRWGSVVSAAAKRGFFDVTVELLASISASVPRKRSIRQTVAA